MTTTAWTGTSTRPPPIDTKSGQTAGAGGQGLGVRVSAALGGAPAAGGDVTLVLDHAADDIANQCVAPAFAVTSGVGRCRLVAGVQRLTFAGVEQPVVIVYASFASTAEPQVLGVASSAQQAEELAERFAEQDRCTWREPDWLEWDSARRVRPAVDARGTTVEVWLVRIALDELTRFTLEAEPLVEEHD